MKISKKKMKRYEKTFSLLHKRLFFWSLFFSYILYFIIFISYIFPEFSSYHDIDTKTNLQKITYFINGYTSIILLIKFNPLRKKKVTDFDRQLVFTAAFAIFTTTFFTSFF